MLSQELSNREVVGQDAELSTEVSATHWKVLQLSKAKKNVSILLQNKDAALILQSRFCEEATVAILSKHWQGPLHVAEDLRPQPAYEPLFPSLTCLSWFHLPQIILVGLALGPLWGKSQT